MAKTFDDGILPIGQYADADMSSYQYHAVIAASTTDYVKLASGASDPYPLGIQQDDDANAVGLAVSVKTFGFTKAVVHALVEGGGTACDIDPGHRLLSGSDGHLYYSSCGIANAVAWETLASGSAIINVFWLGPGGACAYSAS